MVSAPSSGSTSFCFLSQRHRFLSFLFIISILPFEWPLSLKSFVDNFDCNEPIFSIDLPFLVCTFVKLRTDFSTLWLSNDEPLLPPFSSHPCHHQQTLSQQARPSQHQCRRPRTQLHCPCPSRLSANQYYGRKAHCRMKPISPVLLQACLAHFQPHHQSLHPVPACSLLSSQPLHMLRRPHHLLTTRAQNVRAVCGNYFPSER